MHNDERIELVLHEATESLAADPELRQDVREELRTHLEETIDSHRESGDSEEESLEFALKSFGSSEEVGEKLFEANRRRMRLRAWVRLGMRWVLTPLAIGVAVVALGRFEGLWEAGVSYSHFYGPKPPPEHRFLWDGDASRETQAKAQRAIWEADPGNPVYFANYAMCLAADFARGEGVSREFFEQENAGGARHWNRTTGSTTTRSPTHGSCRLKG